MADSFDLALIRHTLPPLANTPPKPDPPRQGLDLWLWRRGYPKRAAEMTAREWAQGRK